MQTRRWMPERFAVVGDALAAHYNATIVITGGRGEWQICEAICRHMHASALNLAGKTSLGALAALSARLQLYIVNDSGPAHLATAVRTRSVVIFGAAQAETWAPLDTGRHRALSAYVPCRPCYFTECPIGYRCLDGVTVDAVVREAESLLGPHAAADLSEPYALV